MTSRRADAGTSRRRASPFLLVPFLAYQASFSDKSGIRGIAERSLIITVQITFPFSVPFISVPF